MSNFDFTSQICTTKEQSERLLALGLKKETADMRYQTHYLDLGGILKECTPSLEPYPPLNNDRFIPAWSLHRLIEMMPQEIFYEDSTLILGVFGDGVYYADNEYGEVFNSFYGNLYDCVVKCIEWLIVKGYFNKKYLEEL